MVLIECKRLPKEEYSKDYDIFILSVPVRSRVAEVTDALQTMQNTRVRLQWMIAAARQLAKDSCSDGGDKEAQAHHLLGPADDAERYLSLEHARQRQACTQAELDTLVEALKGGAMILFPAECSGADACARLAAVLESEEDAVSEQTRSQAHRILSLIDDGASNDAMLHGEAVMWWSGKPLSREAELSSLIGTNEKTKITVKLAPVGGAAPAREPAIDARAQSELMTHFYRKQEEMKKLMEDEDISFGNSQWADPHELKKQLLGTGRISFKPI